MKTLNDFELQMPFVTFNGGIPLKGCRFYMTTDKKSYYECEVDKLQIELFGNNSCPVVLFHSTKGKYKARFSKNNLGKVICHNLVDVKTKEEIPYNNVRLFSQKSDISANKLMSLNIGNDPVNFTGLPFESMYRALNGDGAACGIFYFADFENACRRAFAVCKSMTLEFANGKWVAKDIEFELNPLIARLNLITDGYASEQECWESVYGKIKIIDLPKEERELDLHIKISENDDMDEALCYAAGEINEFFRNCGKGI